MSHNDRIRRPKLERTQPIRSWSAVFGTPSSSAKERGSSLQDAVSRSVDLGYRVVDEYIRRGQKAAQQIGDRSYGSAAMSKDVQELTGRMAQYASEFATVWVELLQLAVGSAIREPAPHGNGARAAAGPTVAPTNGRGERDAPEHTRVKIAVASALPTEVSLDLQSHATSRPLVVHALRAVDPEKPRLADVAFERGTGDEPASLRIHVPEDQPAGIYNGLIIDAATSRPVGTLSVRISASDGVPQG